MKICTKHWAMCREAIEIRGLSHLVKSAEALHSTMVDQLQAPGKKPEPKDYDPLSNLNFMMWGRAVETMGMDAMFVDESKKDDDSANNGHICPLCMAKMSYDHHRTETGRCGDPECLIQLSPDEPPWDTDMIEGASDAVLAYCKELKLVTVQ